MPEHTEDAELLAIKRLLNHRFGPLEATAKLEWIELVEGTHELWKEV